MMHSLYVVFAFCALLGACDRATGNHLGLGERFEDGFRMLGPLAFSMAGILCLSPLLAVLCQSLSPILTHLNVDPSILACLLAIDMGGWQIAEKLASNSDSAYFFGILATATLGCTLSFTIPVGISLFKEENREFFSRGLLYGIITIPIGLFVGALCMKIPLLAAFYLCFPLILLSSLLGIALARHPTGTARVLQGYAVFLRFLATLGLGFAAFSHLSGIILLPGMLPLSEALEVVCSIGIILLGALPLSEILLHVLSRYAGMLGHRIGLSSQGIVGLLLLFVNVTPGLATIPAMENRAKVVAAAFSVSAASCLTAHLAFTIRFAPQVAGALILCKSAGSFSAVALAFLATRNKVLE